MMKTVAAPQLREWLMQGEAVLIDVREPAEYWAQHIAEARLMPLATLGKEGLPEHAGKKLVFQCQAGKRSGMACDKVTELGLEADIYSLHGGIAAWTAAGFPVESSGKFFLPLDRQVQVIVGFCVLLGTILGYVAHPAFLLLAAICGVGLSFAGATGFCGLALLLAKMPWNRGEAGTGSCCATGRGCH